MIETLMILPYGIFEAANKGQLLPQLTLLFAMLSFLHLFFSSKHLTITCVLLLMTNLIGYALVLKLYSHSVRTIFNRKIPITFQQRISSFIAHLALLKPVEIIFRYLTWRWRLLPDIIILGEVRCGTTSLCHQLTSLQEIDCHTPFCLWAHPELDHKETFYFVGHYLGYVTPKIYRMCFPLHLQKMWSTLKCRLLDSKRPFVTFDGCAQYLTSPTAPYLIAEAYREANLPPPILIACVRDPLDQAVSWWRYENAAMQWGTAMGLDTFNTSLRTERYPMKDINDALDYSLGPYVESLYKSAEQLFHSQDLQRLSASNKNVSLPEWAMSWPGGQLSGIGRNSKFFENINRYENVFRYVFGEHENHTRYVTILPLTVQSDPGHIKQFLHDILMQLSYREPESERKKLFQHAAHQMMISKVKPQIVHRNALSKSNDMTEVLSVNSKIYLKEESNKLNGMPLYCPHKEKCT